MSLYRTTGLPSCLEMRQSNGNETITRMAVVSTTHSLHKSRDGIDDTYHRTDSRLELVMIIPIMIGIGWALADSMSPINAFICIATISAFLCYLENK